MKFVIEKTYCTKKYGTDLNVALLFNLRSPSIYGKVFNDVNSTIDAYNFVEIKI